MLYGSLKRVVAPTANLIWRPEVVGLEHVPATGPAILASNHLSLADWVFLGVAAPRHITFVLKSEAVATGGAAGFVIRKLVRSLDQLVVERGPGRAAARALEASMRVLERGELFGIYPEGTRSPDGRLYRGRTGAAWLALASGTPVIPTAMINTDRVLPPGHVLPRPTRVGVRFGPPVDLGAYAGGQDDPTARRAATDEIMDAIGALSGQRRADCYASAAKARVARRRPR